MDGGTDGILYISSVSLVNGNRNVACLYYDDNGRNLNLNWFDNDWNGNYRFLAVRNCFHSSVFDGSFLFNDYLSFFSNHQAFKINDPKPRDIHKASVRDRLVHHAIYRVLYPFFDRKFTDGSFSCRNKKGTHKAIKELRGYFLKVSRNNTRTCYYLKMDIKKFFTNIDHDILLNILQQNTDDKSALWLLENIIDSFEAKKGIGLPLGNLTSQLFVNIYMNKFDQFMKHELKEKYYIRYADDFIILSSSYGDLVDLVPKIMSFLKGSLHLQTHPEKIFIKTFASGLDFLGYVNFLDHRLLRTKTKKRALKKINLKNLSSYFGLLKHCNSYKLKQKLEKRLKGLNLCVIVLFLLKLSKRSIFD